jgi:hypothetical protein
MSNVCVLFKDLEGSAGLEERARAGLSNVLDRAPYGSLIFARVEAQATEFRCSLDFHDGRRVAFGAECRSRTALGAIEAAAAKLASYLSSRAVRPEISEGSGIASLLKLQVFGSFVPTRAKLAVT